MTKGSVHTTRNRVNRKLGVRTQAHLGLLAVELGLVSVTPRSAVESEVGVTAGIARVAAAA